MAGIKLEIYTLESRKHGGMLLYEWLLHEAKKIGIDGGSVFRSIAGYGHQGRVREEHFFELGSDLSVVLAFALEEEEADAILSRIREEKLDLFYCRSRADFGTT